ncbi:hypothetical protein SAMN05446635_6789 [Burkholderia sp. OK233]|nr:hypothetical protein SAMN05446635_6789 [Burkholderia sp. OK233]
MCEHLKPLRSIIEKWLPPTIDVKFRVSLTGRTHSERARIVCVEMTGNDRNVSLLFFRHRDGQWYVFPPGQARASMGIC